jgi:hypothetical protein
MEFTIGFPVRNRIQFANQAITSMLSNSEYPIIIIDDCSDSPDGEYITNPRVKVIYNKQKMGLTHLWNQILKESQTEYIILAGDKIRMQKKDFELIENKLKEGFGIVATYMLGVFGFSKYLTTKIGLFDEGFKNSGYEDTDTMNKLFINDIALYFSKETEYISVNSGWSYSDTNQFYYKTKWIEDWENRELIQLKNDENFSEQELFFGFNNNGINYLPWSRSELKESNVINYYNNLTGIKKYNK